MKYVMLMLVVFMVGCASNNCNKQNNGKCGAEQYRDSNRGSRS